MRSFANSFPCPMLSEIEQLRPLSNTVSIFLPLLYVATAYWMESPTIPIEVSSLEVALLLLSLFAINTLTVMDMVL